jgi:hypothetical protein
MESLDVSGGGVMSDPKEQKEPSEREEDRGKQPAPKKPPGYQNFERLLRQVVKAPPLRKRSGKSTAI